MPEVKILPDTGWSREYAFTTHAADGWTEYMQITLKTLLLPNVIDVSTVKQESSFPEQMNKDDIKQYYVQQFEQARLFYWVNSRMKYFIDQDLYIDETMYRTGDISKGNFKDDAEKKRYETLPLVNPDRSLNEQIKKAGKEQKIYFGQVQCICETMWNPARKIWEYRGSGGGTYGIEWPLPGRSNFLGGSDVAWLFGHEYKHQVESNYELSGLDKDEDRMWFCHFATEHSGWPLQSAENHGEHWDGIAWQLRHHKRDSYLRAIYGFAETARDSDEDGIPDDAPFLPLDEKRLGSSPVKKDSDNDGLDDMNEVLSSKWVKAMNLAVRERIEVNYIRPNLTASDSDGDGIPDGKDKYPIYPYSDQIKMREVTIDGKLSDWPAKPQIQFSSQGIDIEVWSAWADMPKDANDKTKGRGGLSFAMRLKGAWSRAEFVLDLNADGFYRGNDNLKVDVRLDEKTGPKLLDAIVHICAEDRWPFFDNEHRYFKPDDLQFASSVDGDSQIFEFSIDKKEKIGLELMKGEQIGLMIYISPVSGGQFSVFEPYSIFDCTLTD